MEHPNAKQYNRFMKIINENFIEERLKLQQKKMCKYERRQAAHSRGLFPAIKGAISDKKYIDRFRKEPTERLWLKVIRRVMLTCYFFTILYSYRFSPKVIFNDFSIEVKRRRLLTFNPSYYKSSNSPNVDFKDIATCKQDPRCRTEEQIQHLLSTLIEFPIIHNHFTNKERWLLSQHIKYIQLDKRRVITRHEDNPMNIYFLYSGEIHVYVNATKRCDENSLKDQKKVILHKGSYFGHMKNTSYAICGTECELFMIPISLLHKLKLNRGLDLMDDIKCAFFRHWSPISDWSDNAITDLSNQSYLYKKPGQQLILDNEKEQNSDVVWFILHGSIDIFKITSLEKCSKMMKDFDNIVLKKKGKLKAESMKTFVFKPVVSKSYAPELCSEKSKSKNYAKAEYELDMLKTFEDKQSGKNKDIKKPIYLKIGKLTTNQCYGLGKLGVSNIQNHSNRFCLVGNNCIYIETPVSNLKALIEVLGVKRDLLKNSEFDLPSDLKISKIVCDRFIDKVRGDKIMKEIYARKKLI